MITRTPLPGRWSQALRFFPFLLFLAAGCHTARRPSQAPPLPYRAGDLLIQAALPPTTPKPTASASRLKSVAPAVVVDFGTVPPMPPAPIRFEVRHREVNWLGAIVPVGPHCFNSFPDYIDRPTGIFYSDWEWLTTGLWEYQTSTDGGRTWITRGTVNWTDSSPGAYLRVALGMTNGMELERLFKPQP